MLTVQAYLQSPKTRKVLSKKPGDEGFSLIELVVVVAVLAILAAIAIPSFTAINNNAAQAAAKNTIATIAKECAVKVANLESNPTFNVPQLQAYTVTPANGDCTPSDNWITATRNTDASDEVPEVIRYNVDTGVKNCTVGENVDWCVDSVW